MKVIRAQVSGFCMGVRCAVTLATEASAHTNVYTLGPLIHNPRVLNDLEKLGIKTLKQGEIPPKSETAIVIIRAHGIAPQTEKELAQQGIKVIDATCPHVKANQKKAADFAAKGYVIFLAGEKDHAEIDGIRGYVNSVCLIVSNPIEADAAATKLAHTNPAIKTALIGQTTISPEEYRAIGEAIKKYFPQLEIIDTICSATEDRQKALAELCAQTQAVIIIGGRNSANTQRLFSLASELGKPCWLIEDAKEIPAEIRQYEIVGLASGASTPDSLIDEIEAVLTL